MLTSWRKPLNPQQRAVPSCIAAHVWCRPALTLSALVNTGCTAAPATANATAAGQAASGSQATRNCHRRRHWHCRLQQRPQASATAQPRALAWSASQQQAAARVYVAPGRTVAQCTCGNGEQHQAGSRPAHFSLGARRKRLRRPQRKPRRVGAGSRPLSIPSDERTPRSPADPTKAFFEFRGVCERSERVVSSWHSRRGSFVVSRAPTRSERSRAL